MAKEGKLPNSCYEGNVTLMPKSEFLGPRQRQRLTKRTLYRAIFLITIDAKIIYKT